MFPDRFLFGFHSVTTSPLFPDCMPRRKHPVYFQAHRECKYTKKLLTTKKKLIKHTKSLNGSKWQSIHSIRQKYNPESVNNCFTRLFAGLDLLPRCYFIIYEKIPKIPIKNPAKFNRFIISLI